MHYRKNVKGERLLAAIIDGFIMSIIEGIISTILIIAFRINLEFENFMEILDLVTNEFVEYTIVITLITVIIGVIYFGYIPSKYNGQTLGKKLMRVKVVMKKTGENPTLPLHAARTMTLWQNYLTLPALAIYLVSVESFIATSSSFSFVTGLLILVSLIMILTDKNGEGLHDRIFNTLVVDERYQINGNESLNLDEAKDSEKVEPFDPFDDEFETYSKKSDPWNE
ncbi:MAG: RDD family protein [Candidatus Izemoplasmataceae bacterium]|jgi:uncharacterized RDD family membrane protein YckC